MSIPPTARPDPPRPVPRPAAVEDPCPIACPVCGGKLIEIRAKLTCSHCRTIVETCCEGGRG